MKRKNSIKKMINQERLGKNIEHLPNQQALELNNGELDIITTVSNNTKQQPATSTRAAISKSFIDKGVQDLEEHKILIEKNYF